MKMVQEVRGLAQITSRRPASRNPGPLLLEFRGSNRRSAAARPRHTIKILMLDKPDIPSPVPITYLAAPKRAARKPAVA